MNTDRTVFRELVSQDSRHLYFTSDPSFADTSWETALSTREWNDQY